MRQIIKKSLPWAVLLSETTHVFCCVLPTLFSLLGLLASVGVITVMPAFMVQAHDMIHEWELPIIGFSGVMLALGWGAVLYGDKIDCHSTGCHHGECAPKKSRAHKLMMIATVLFLFNVAVYTLVHRSEWFQAKTNDVHEHHEHEHQR